MYEVDQYTVSLLHFEDGLKDECGNMWISTGNATVSTEQKVVGNSSLYTPASSFLTSTNDKYAFGTGDFTIDFWMYYESGYSGVSSSHSSGTGVVIQTDNINFGNSTSSSSLITKTPGFVLNKWAHYALVRKSGIVYWFVNGALQTTITGASNITINQFAINARYGNGSYAGGVAYYDEFRISNIARWTEGFTPGQTPIPAPINLTATASDSQVTLSWNAVTGDTGYNVKRSTTAGGPYTTIATKVTGTTYVDKAVTNGITYYYVVTALNAGNESANSNEASATPQAPSSHGLLRVTMNDSSEREYQLSTTEIDGFINWVKGHISTDSNCYMLNKIEVLQNSKEYLMFEKIISFEVMELTK